jgi:starvation-inducible DNA-binding protein
MGTNDFLIGIMEKHEKMAWMLRAHVENAWACFLFYST